MKSIYSPFISLTLATLLISSSIQADTPDLFDMSLADLGKIEITSVNRNKSTAKTTPAAVFVITQEDIRRSTANSIPELLRMVPGLHVAKINAHSWAITSRGFNNGFANKLLVLIDGRSIYTPIFSGVNWELLDLVLNDIERIEVIRGPGATIWGANAVNGVINIITKSSKDTLGTFVSAGGGSEDHAIVSLRQGEKLGENTTARIYAKGSIRDGSKELDGSDAFDRRKTLQSGIRFDHEFSEEDKLMLAADIQAISINGAGDFPTLSPPYSSRETLNSSPSGENILVRWDHENSKDSNLFVQASYTGLQQETILGNSNYKIYDLEVQQFFRINKHHAITAGIGQRIVDTFLGASPVSDFVLRSDPNVRNYDVSNVYLQDEITILPDTLTATAGIKLEYRDYTGVQVQPGLRVGFTPTEGHFFWGSIAKAVRTPSQVERDASINFSAFPSPMGTPRVLAFQGDADIGSEKLVAYELGYRSTPIKDVSIDVTSFINSYSNFIGVQPLSPTFISASTPYILIPSVFQSNQRGEVYGTEVLVSWEVLDWWRLSGWYSYLDLNVNDASNSGSPHNQFFVRSLMTIAEKWELDPIFRYVSSVQPAGAQSVNIAAYGTVDVRLGYKATSNITLSLIGRNLINEAQAEFVSAEGIRPVTENERAVFFKVDANF